jgi:hypothetical protein
VGYLISHLSSDLSSEFANVVAGEVEVANGFDVENLENFFLVFITNSIIF